MMTGRLLTIAALLACTGCVRLPGDVLRASGTDYNIALQRAADEQLLLNLVRLRYRDTPYFLEAASVSSQFRMAGEASINATFRERQTPEQVGLGGSLGFSEQPTVSWGPLRGSEFVQRLLAPIPVATIVLLYNSGWSISRVLRVTVQRLNGLPNAPSASGPTPARAPEYQAFTALARALRTAQQRGWLELGFRDDGERRVAVARFAEAAGGDRDLRSALAAAGIDVSLGELELVAGSAVGAGRPGTITLNTRSLLGAMYFLSQAVEVPTEDRSRGVVTVTRTAAGEPFDWGQVTAGLFRVATDGRPPSGAAVRARYRGRWFFIDDADLESKSTFSLLAQLFSLQAGKGESSVPVLTLPVGG